MDQRREGPTAGHLRRLNRADGTWRSGQRTDTDAEAADPDEQPDEREHDRARLARHCVGDVTNLAMQGSLGACLGCSEQRREAFFYSIYA